MDQLAATETPPTQAAAPGTQDDKAKRLLDRLAALKSDRSQHEQTWRDCFDYTWPMRGEAFNGDITNAASAQNKRARLLDSTGTDAARTLASGLQAGLTPANSRWFQIAVDGASDEERQWLDVSSDIIWQNIHAANFDAEAFECMMDAVGAGWFCLFCDYKRDQAGRPIGFHFEHWAIHAIYIAASVRGGPVDTVFMELRMSAEQALTAYGLGNVSEKVLTAIQNGKPDDLFDFVITIYPRKDGTSRGFATNLPYASCHVDVRGRKVVRESGFNEMPAIVARWNRIPNSSYAVGPVFDALPDIKQLNELTYLETAAADLAISGMWIAEDDGVLNPRTVKVGPKTIIAAGSTESMKPLVPGSNFEIAWTQKQQLQQAIRRTLMADQLQPQDKPQMTATEVQVRVGLIRQLLGPMYGRMQAEYLAPLVIRCFGLAMRANALPPAPQSLMNRDYTVEYLSPLARAQKLEDVTAMDRFETTLLQEMSIKAEIIDIYNFDKAASKRAQLLGVPADVLNNERQVKAIRQSRVAAQAKAKAEAATATAAAAGAQGQPGPMAAALVQANTANIESQQAITT